MRNFIITEEEKNSIRKMYGLIMEQNKIVSKNKLIPDRGMDAILGIEGKYSYADPNDNNNIKGQTFSQQTVDAHDDKIKEFIENTIGRASWDKIDEKFRTQIYAFMFQVDSGGMSLTEPDHFKWLAGICQAIDPNFNRSSIVNKSPQDKSVLDAIKMVQKACSDGTINGYYQSYLTVLGQQYASINDAYQSQIKTDKNDPKAVDKKREQDYIWVHKQRPGTIDKIMNGQDIQSALKDWETAVLNPTTTTTTTIQGGQVVTTTTTSQVGPLGPITTTTTTSQGGTSQTGDCCIKIEEVEQEVKDRFTIPPRTEEEIKNGKALKKGMSGCIVARVQAQLKKKGYTDISKSGNPDGLYGKRTFGSVKKFQAANGIKQTGNVANLTWPKLMNDEPENCKTGGSSVTTTTTTSSNGQSTVTTTTTTSNQQLNLTSISNQKISGSFDKDGNFIPNK